MEKPNKLFWWLDHGDRSYNSENIVLLKLEFLVVWMMEEIAFESEE